MPAEDDDVEVMVVRGPGAKTFLSQLGELSGSAEDAETEEFDEVEDDDGRTWRSPKVTEAKPKLKVKDGGKEDKPASFGSRFFGTG